MPASHRLDATVVHYEWNNAIPPRLVVEPGDTLVLDTRDAADGYYTADVDEPGHGGARARSGATR